MKGIMFFLLTLLPLLSVSCQTEEASNKSAPNVYGISVKDMSGKTIQLSEYEGKVLLIVNVASECGYTSQYEGLQNIYEMYNDKGFEILAFPCNDFGGQEPGTNEEIQQFCSSTFGVTFKLFDKIKVLGEEKEPLYKLLTNNAVTGKSEIAWNFEKFLISRNGDIVKRYLSKVKPESDELIKDIEAQLAL
jgi:glutathione peroxidase